MDREEASAREWCKQNGYVMMRESVYEQDVARAYFEGQSASTSEIPNKWIPASEPPKKEGKYLVCIEYKHKGVVVERYQMTADFYRFSHIDMSWCPDNENAAGDIVAWRELPEPYKAESEDT